MSTHTSSEVKELSSVEKELSIVVAGELITKEVDKAYQRISQKARLKGFRPGKVPRHVLEQYYKGDAEREALNQILNTTYRNAITSHKIAPVADPEVNADGEFIPGMDFRYSAKVQVRPEITSVKWEGLLITVPEYALSESSIDKELERLRHSNSTIKTVEDRTSIEQGDLVECSGSTRVDGDHCPELSGVALNIEVGSSNFLPAIEQALVGKKVGEKYELEAVIPENFRVESLRGKTAQITIQPKSIKVRVLPNLDDEFAKDLSEQFATLEDLKKAIREQIEASKARREEEEREEAVIAALIEKNPIEVPSRLVEKQIEYMLGRLLSQFPEEQARALWQAQGERMQEDAKPKATHTVKASLLLDAIIGENNLEITNEEIEAEFESEAARMNIPVARLKAYYKDQDSEAMKKRLLGEKAIKLITEKAKIKTEKKSL